MLKRFASAIFMIAGISFSAFAASPSSVNMLVSSNATWSIDTAKSTLVIGTRASGDSVVATWTMQSGLWSNTWNVLVATPPAGLFSGADSIKIIFKNTSILGFSLRLTQKDGTVYQSDGRLNGTVGLIAANYKLDSANFPQQWVTGGKFNLDSVKTVSFVNNADPTVLTSAGATGVFTILTFTVIKKSAATRFDVAARPALSANLKVSSHGVIVPSAGEYTISLYGANGATLYNMKSQLAAGFNKIDFARLGSGVHIARVSGNGISGSARVTFNK
jgi:hypothetical protein